MQDECETRPEQSNQQKDFGIRVIILEIHLF